MTVNTAIIESGSFVHRRASEQCRQLQMTSNPEDVGAVLRTPERNGDMGEGSAGQKLKKQVAVLERPLK